MISLNVKYVYLIGDDSGYCGFSYNKHDAKWYVEKNPGTRYVRVKRSHIMKKCGRLDNELVLTTGGYLMFADEEEYMLQGFDQYTMDCIRYIDSFKMCVKYLKLSDKDQKKIKSVMKLFDEVRNAQIHGLEYDDDNSIYDYENISQWYITNVLHKKV